MLAKVAALPLPETKYSPESETLAMSEHIRMLAATDRERLLQDLVEWVTVELLDAWQFTSALQLATEFDAENVIDAAVDTVSHGHVHCMPLELVAAIARHPTPSGTRWLSEIVRGAGVAKSREDRHLAIRAWIAAAVTAKPRGAEPELAKALKLLRTWSDVGLRDRLSPSLPFSRSAVRCRQRPWTGCCSPPSARSS